MAKHNLHLDEFLAGKDSAFDRATEILVDDFRNVDFPEVSFVVPVHNQADNVVRCLESIVTNASASWELIVIFDGCSDKSEENVRAWMRANSVENVCVVVTGQDVFETLCDHIGFSLARGAHLIEVQSDMFISDLGFDTRLLAWFETDRRLVAISGRGGHSFTRTGLTSERSSFVSRAVSKCIDIWTRLRRSYSPTVLEAKVADGVGRTGARIDFPLRSTVRDRLYIQPTVMRGPLVIPRDKYFEIGGFDFEHFFLGNDDHDFCARAASLGHVVGFVPVAFESPTSLGATRREKTPEEKATFEKLVAHYDVQYQKSFLARALGDLSRKIESGSSVQGAR